jgi:MoaA/NifB/PqqE/SkfB family radical SAM enzyme
MDVRLFERIIDQVGPYLLTASLWAWGEPLLHPRLKEVLRAARKHGVITLLSTNGQHLGKESVLEALIDEPPDYLILAFDGLTDGTNSAYRVGAALEPILDGVKKLAAMKRARGAAKPVLNMRFIVMKHNQHELASLDEFAARHGFEMLTIRNIFFIESTTAPGTSEALAPEADAWLACGHGREGNATEDGFICMEPFWFPTVFADGTLVLCEQDYNAELSPGLITEDVSFDDLWYSPQARRLRRTIRESRELVSFCRKCPYAGRPVTDFNIEARDLSSRVDA